MRNVVIYTTDDGATKIDLRLEEGTAWLSQLQIAELFQTTKQNVSKHIQAIYDDQELEESATVNQQLTVQKEAKTLDPVEKDYLQTISDLNKQAKQQSRKKGGDA
jgi:hypothetical protein